MSRAVYIGGFGNGEASAERVAEAFINYGYDDVDPFTFSWAMRFPDEIRKAAKNVDAYSHSAGMIPLIGMSPESLTAFNAPVPASVSYLAAKTILKTVHMHLPGRGIKAPRDILSVVRYNASAVAELAKHPKGNIAQLRSHITKFDAFATALHNVEMGIPTGLVYTYNDDYYPGALYDQDTVLAAIDAGVGHRYLFGEHDELVLRPAQTLDQYFNPAPAH